MKPILFTFTLPWLGTTHISSFFFTIFAGAMLATYWVVRSCRRQGLSPVVGIDMGITAMLASVVGSRVFHIIFEYPGYYWEHPWRVFDFLSGGFVSLGAFILTVVVWVYYFKWKGLSAAEYFDCGARGCPIIDFFVRLGCLLIGCCYGRETGCWLHLRFPPGSTAYYFMKDAPLHATQVYFMINAVCMWAGIHWWGKRRQFPGQLTALFLIWYGASRFLIEFLRGDRDRGMYLEWLIPTGISTGQFFMLLSMGTGLWLWRHWRRAAAAPGERHAS